MSEYAGKVVLVTGGGTGIGKSIAAKFAEQGASVVIAGRREEVLQETARELGEKAGYVVADVSQPGEAKRLVNETISIHKKLDILVNNAGAALLGPLSEASDDVILGIYKTNVFGPLALSRECLGHLTAAKGSIINISTTMSKGVVPGSAVYSSSKAALDHATRLLAAEFGPVGIRVNGVAPGLTVTDMTKGVREDKEMLSMMVGQTPLGRVGTPDEVADAVLMLCSKRAGWVTGQVVQAGGGIML